MQSILFSKKQSREQREKILIFKCSAILHEIYTTAISSYHEPCLLRIYPHKELKVLFFGILCIMNHLVITNSRYYELLTEVVKTGFQLRQSETIITVYKLLKADWKISTIWLTLLKDHTVAEWCPLKIYPSSKSIPNQGASLTLRKLTCNIKIVVNV